MCQWGSIRYHAQMGLYYGIVMNCINTLLYSRWMRPWSRPKTWRRCRDLKIGWVKAIRKALNMSARQLGERLQLSQPRIALLEKGEVDSSISLRTLEKAAEGLGCRLVYVLVPEDSTLQAMRETQARLKAQALNAYTEHHMALEDQATGAAFRQQTTDELANELLRTWPRDFWDN